MDKSFYYDNYPKALYFIGYFFLAPAAVIHLLSLLIESVFNCNLPPYISSFIGIFDSILILCFCSQFVREITYWSLSKIKFSKNILSWGIGITASLTSIPALIFSRLLINQFTRVNVSNLPFALSIITLIVSTVFYTFITLTLLCLLYLLAVVLLIPYYVKTLFDNIKLALKGKEKFSKITDNIGRVMGSSLLLYLVGYFMLVPILNSVTSELNSPDIDRKAQTLITNLIVYSNYAGYSDECNNHKAGEWTLTLGVKKVSVAIPNQEGGFSFQVRNCELNIE